ncbi:MAG: hypothetical protein PWQ55_1272 [Chloroflexota bacterium]|nr:hypothetical protein [Chloroflexota bacterium]
MPWFKIIALLGTALTGLYALVKPLSVEGFTGLQVGGPRGVTEVRAIFGALFLALGLVPLVSGEPAMAFLAGAIYLAVALVRAVSIFMDGSPERSNWISLAVEIVFGLLLVL